jgi:hypothetical protein
MFGMVRLVLAKYVWLHPGTGPNSCLTFLTADADGGCRWRARLAWRVGKENDESEVQDSRGIRRHARNSQTGQKEAIAAPGQTEWLVRTLLLVSAEEYSDGSIHRSASGKMPHRHSVSSLCCRW